jgi:hypothetical protein
MMPANPGLALDIFAQLLLSGERIGDRLANHAIGVGVITRPGQAHPEQFQQAHRGSLHG